MTCRPSASVTTRSGRTPAPWSLVPPGCSTKSQCSSRPATSTTRRSCTSPHRPRTCGVRSAVTSAAVSWLELRRGLADRAHLLAELAVRGGPVALDAGQQPVQVVQRLVHRLEPGVRRAGGGTAGRPRPRVTAVASSAPRRRPVSREAASMPGRVPEGVRQFRRRRSASRSDAELPRGSGDGGVLGLVVEQPPLDRCPQRKPPSPPSEPSTRWQGTNSAAALRAQALAAARTAAGPAAAGGEGGVGVGPPGGHGPQHLPGLACRNGPDRWRTTTSSIAVDVAGEERLDDVEHGQPRRRRRTAPGAASGG